MIGLFFHLKKYASLYIIAILGLTLFFLISYINSQNRDGVLEFTVLDVGQGDALFIESPTGKQVLIDGGSGRNIMREIPKVVSWYDREIDILIVTNPDRDHYEGFLPLLSKYKTDLFIEPGTKNDKGVYDFLLEKLGEMDVPKILARRGQKIDLGGGAYLEILFPDRDVSGLSVNDGSIIMKLIYGETSVLLQGDSTKRMENFILTSVATTTLKSDIIKIGHHGSKTSSGFEYVKTVSPKYAVISSGEDNDYGHPHRETLETLKSLKIITISTCNNGTIYFESDGKEFKLKNKKVKEALVGCKT